MLDHVFGLGLSAPATDGVLERIAAFYGRQPYWIALAPHASPAGLGDRLRALGFAEDYAWTKFRRGVDDPPETKTSLRVEEALPRHAEAYGRVVCAAFGYPGGLAPWPGAVVGRPGWRCFTALAGDEPVATGALFVHEDEGWLTLGATLPGYRGQGAQSTLLAVRIRAAAEAGCRLLTTETGAPVTDRPSNSHRNILRAGFEIAYVRPNLRAPAAS
jgi:GNAT superfamily N-acetyltransferase